MKKFFTFMAAIAAVTFANASAPLHIGPVANVIDVSPMALQTATYRDAISVAFKKSPELRKYVQYKEANPYLTEHIGWIYHGANTFTVVWVFEQSNSLWISRSAGPITVDLAQPSGNIYTGGGSSIDGWPGMPFRHEIDLPAYAWANEPGGACEGHLNP